MSDHEKIREALLLLASAIENGRISGVYEDVTALLSEDDKTSGL